MKTLLILVVIMMLSQRMFAQEFTNSMPTFTDSDILLEGESVLSLSDLQAQAEQGDSQSQRRLGNRYFQGTGIPRNSIEAVKWYRLSAGQGNERAQRWLGRIFFEGNGVIQDYSESARWMELAGQKGDNLSQRRLGFLYYEGLGVTKSFVEAARWYRRAAEQGNATAQFKLGGMFRNGEGVTKDAVTSYMWINISAVNGDQNYIGDRNLFESTLSAGQVADGQLRARICFTSDYQDCD